LVYRYDYWRPALTVDLILWRQFRGQLYLALIQREREPFAGKWALPGGFVDEGEQLDVAAVREMREETGADIKLEDLIQLGAYGDVDRDPRSRTLSVVFMGAEFMGTESVPRESAQSSGRHKIHSDEDGPGDCKWDGWERDGLLAADDASDAKWKLVKELPDLAFDHASIIADGLHRIELLSQDVKREESNSKVLCQLSNPWVLFLKNLEF